MTKNPLLSRARSKIHVKAKWQYNTWLPCTTCFIYLLLFCPCSCPLIKEVRFTTSTWGGEDTSVGVGGIFLSTVLSPWEVRRRTHGYVDRCKKMKKYTLQLFARLACIFSTIRHSQRQEQIWHSCHRCSQNAFHLCTDVFWWDWWI